MKFFCTKNKKIHNFTNDWNPLRVWNFLFTNHITKFCLFYWDWKNVKHFFLLNHLFSATSFHFLFSVKDCYTFFMHLLNFLFIILSIFTHNYLKTNLSPPLFLAQQNKPQFGSFNSMQLHLMSHKHTHPYKRTHLEVTKKPNV